jgi:hypothetical protein
MLITTKPFLANEDEEETCVEEEEILEAAARIHLYKIVQSTTIKPQTPHLFQGITIIGEDHQDNKAKNLVKYVEEQIILPQNAITGMNITLKLKIPKKHWQH